MLLKLSENTWTSYSILPEKMTLSEEEFKKLWEERPEKASKVIIYGKEMDVPRRQQSYGISYRFSGTINRAKEFIPIIQKYLDYANEIDTSEGIFNMALVNWYKDGDEYIGHHSDDEKQLISNSPIYCFSFGHARDFLLKNKTTGEVKKLILENNSLVVMGGECQKTHTHSIPKRKKVKEARISITLRKFIV